MENGVLIIEVKGIGGTSKDNECSQISKIKLRRSKERGNFDVYALYIVNHQRYLPPKERQNPPFLEHQIADALNDERGLLTTWDLFKSYFMVNNGIIDKSFIRSRILEFGLVHFEPDHLPLLGIVDEVYRNGKVFILTLKNVTVKKGDVIVISHDEEYFKATVMNMQVEGVDVNEADSGEIGFEIDSAVKRKSKIYRGH